MRGNGVKRQVFWLSGYGGTPIIYPRFAKITFCLIIIFLCVVLSVSAREHIFNYCKNRFLLWPSMKYLLYTYDDMALNILRSMNILYRWIFHKQLAPRWFQGEGEEREAFILSLCLTSFVRMQPEFILYIRRGQSGRGLFLCCCIRGIFDRTAGK